MSSSFVSAFSGFLFTLITISCAVTVASSSAPSPPFLLFSSAPSPPCLTNIPNSAVLETWCSQVLAQNASSGVIVAQYGAPTAETLVSVTVGSQFWYGFPMFGASLPLLFEYFEGANAANASFIKNGRTAPLSVRPPHSENDNYTVSMMISTVLYPDASKIPAPTSPFVRLEPLGSHTFATLSFQVNASSYIAFDSPPFPFFLECDQRLLSGLPNGWTAVKQSAWTPAWNLYNNQSFRGVWTAQCVAEVVQSTGRKEMFMPGRDLLSVNPPHTIALFTEATTAFLQSLPSPATLSLAKSGPVELPPPDVCAVLLEFETVCWGSWVPPHSPNVELPDVNGGTDGLCARGGDDTMFLSTAADAPFFSLRLVALNTTTGRVVPVGPNNNPLAPTGFEGTGGIPFSVDFDASMGGLIIGMTEISLFGPLTPPCFLGWTVIARTDPVTGVGTPLTNDITPMLNTLPLIFRGISTLDATRTVLWLVGDDASAEPGSACPPPPIFPPFPPAVPAAMMTKTGTPVPPVLIGVKLSVPTTAPLVISLMGNGAHALALEYASSVDSIITLEYNITDIWAPPSQPGAAYINLYPLSGPTAGSFITLGLIPGGPSGIVPSAGQSEVSADGRFVYFGATQASAEFESSALIVVDVVAKTFTLTKAAPTDDYDILALGRC